LGLSTGIPALLESSGIMPCRAVMPGVSRSEPANKRASSCQNSSPTVRYSAGIAATVRPLARSETTLVSLNPSRSTTGPPNNEASTAASATAPPAIPVSAALPVVCNANHGTATKVSMFPTCESAVAASMA
jgi:hypothetical protein